MSKGVNVEIQNVYKQFDQTTVLHGINLKIESGEFVAVIGRSGCGKSTLLRLISGLEDITSGEVKLDNQPLKGIHPDIRVMFQDPRLLPWKKVIENIALGLPKAQIKNAEIALEQVGLSEKSNVWPSVLSGGQKQRVSLARALASNPKFLLLDEPLGALDALTRIEMQQLIEKLWIEQQFTTLLITHDVEEAIILADRIVLIENGKIAQNIKVPFSRPRDRSNPEFAQLMDSILKRLIEGKVIPSYYSVTAVS